jgi:hypothetical protein
MREQVIARDSRRAKGDGRDHGNPAAYSLHRRKLSHGGVTPLKRGAG